MIGNEAPNNRAFNEEVSKTRGNIDTISSLTEFYNHCTRAENNSYYQSIQIKTEEKDERLITELATYAYPDDFLEWHRKFGNSNIHIGINIISTNELLEQLRGFYSLLTKNNYLFISTDGAGNALVYNANKSPAEVIRIDHECVYQNEGLLAELYSEHYNFWKDVHGTYHNPNKLDINLIYHTDGTFVADSIYIKKYFEEQLKEKLPESTFLELLLFHLRKNFDIIIKRYNNIKDKTFAEPIYAYLDDEKEYGKLHNKGYDFYLEQKYKKSIELFLRASKLQPNASTFMALARAFTAIKKKAEAIEAYTKVIEFSRFDCSLYNSKAFLQYELEQYTEALETINTGIDVDESYALAVATKAEILFKMGREEDFFIALTDATQKGINPGILDPEIVEKYGNTSRYQELSKKYRK